nr:hypothetical protein [Tanacetum cinerariifolium]
DFQNAFNLVDRTVMLQEVRLHCPAISCWVEFCYSSPARLYSGEHSLWSCQGVQQGDPLRPLLFSLVLHPLVCKIRDSFDLCLHAWYLDDGTVAGDTLVVASGFIFEEALCVFNNAVGIDFLSNPSEVAAPKLMKKMADIYFTRVAKDAESSFSLSPRQMALWQSQRDDHTSDWLRVVSISGLGQTMNGKTYRSVLCYRLGVPLFTASKPCSVCSRVFAEDIYGDHDVSCAGIIGIKHRHNVVRDTLVDICFRAGILAGKEVDIGLDRGNDKKLRPIDMLLYSWDRGLDVCVDLTGSSPLTQTGMTDFATSRVVSDAAH